MSIIVAGCWIMMVSATSLPAQCFFTEKSCEEAIPFATRYVVFQPPYPHCGQVW